MINTLFNVILFRKCRIKRKWKKFVNILESKAINDIMDVLFKLFSLVFVFDKKFRKNIENFNARYLFKSKDNEIHVAAVFKNSKMKVYKKEIDNTNVTVIFKDAPSLVKFITSDNPNLLIAILNQDIVVSGNLNYIYKFGYMAKHLQVMITGWL